MPNVYIRNPFSSGVPTAAMIGAPMRLQTLIKACHTSSCSVDEDYVILLNMCELDTELSSSLDSQLGGNSTNTSLYV